MPARKKSAVKKSARRSTGKAKGAVKVEGAVKKARASMAKGAGKARSSMAKGAGKVKSAYARTSTRTKVAAAVTGAAAVVALTAAVRSRPKKKKKRIWG